MPVPRRRHCPSRKRRGRAHHAMTATASTNCPSCGAQALPHHVCPECGSYKGRTYKVVVKR